MDMGFHRRARRIEQGRAASADLASLLASLAARQAVSPTAKAVAGASASVGPDDSVHPEIAVFASETISISAQTRPVSFHPAVSAAILSTRQQS
jgi:hypothetical protein